MPVHPTAFKSHRILNKVQNTTAGETSEVYLRKYVNNHYHKEEETYQTGWESSLEESLEQRFYKGNNILFQAFNIP